MADTQTANVTVCEYCGPNCYGGAAHNARVEDRFKWSEGMPAAAPPVAMSTPTEPVVGEARTAAELLPCPFCGDHKFRYAGIPQRGLWPVERMRLMCECGAVGPFGDTEEGVRFAWNTRALSAPQQPVADVPSGDTFHVFVGQVLAERNDYKAKYEAALREIAELKG